MEALFNNIGALVAFYAPVVLTCVVQIVTLIKDYVAIKSNDIRGQLKPVIEQNKQLINELKQAKMRENKLLEALTKVEVKDNE